MRVKSNFLLPFILSIIGSSCVTQKVFDKAVDYRYHESFKKVFWIKPLSDTIIVINGIGNVGRSGIFDSVCLAIVIPKDYMHIANGKIDNNALTKKYYKETYKDLKNNLYLTHIDSCKSFLIKDLNLVDKREIPFVFLTNSYQKRGYDESKYLDTLIQKQYYNEIICIDTTEGNLWIDHLILGNNNEIIQTSLQIKRTFKYRKRQYFCLLPFSITADIILLPVYIPVGILVALGVVHAY